MLHAGNHRRHEQDRASTVTVPGGIVPEVCQAPHSRRIPLSDAGRSQCILQAANRSWHRARLSQVTWLPGRTDSETDLQGRNKLEDSLDKAGPILVRWRIYESQMTKINRLACQSPAPIQLPRQLRGRRSRAGRIGAYLWVHSAASTWFMGDRHKHCRAGLLAVLASLCPVAINSLQVNTPGLVTGLRTGTCTLSVTD